MRLYRGQPTAAAVAAAETRRSPWLADAVKALQYEPAGRAQGRWFTDDPEIARWYVDDSSTTAGTAEVVMIDVPDALAETFRVSNTPETTCGLSPGRFSKDPEREFLLPRDLADRAVPLETSNESVDLFHPIMDNLPFGGKTMADDVITYESEDASKQDARFRKLFALPGDRLRVDPKARAGGIEGSTLMETLGSDALTVSKTVVAAESGYVVSNYEFEGVEGRHNTSLFQHEKGEQGMHAVVAMRNEEMWAVPIDVKYGDIDKGEPDVVTLEGPAREITGFTGRATDELHPEGLEGMRKEAAEGAFIADLYVRNATTFEDRTGPVELVAMPMAYGSPNVVEMDVATRAIDEAAFEKRIGEVVRDSSELLRMGGLEHEDGRERSEATNLADALYAHGREPSQKNSGHVLDAANEALGMMDDNGLSSRPSYDKLAYSVEAAERAGDDVLRTRYADLGLQPAVARQMETLAKYHDDAMDAEPAKPAALAPALKGAMLAAQAGRGV